MKEKAMQGLRNFMRELVFGMEDGLVSNFGIVFAVYIATGSRSAVLLAGMASMFAGALSMAAGSYLSSKSVKEVYQAEIARAEKLVRSKPKKAGSEMRKFLKQEMFDKNEIDVMMRHFLKHNSKTFAINYIQKKMCLNPSAANNPFHDATVMFLAFGIGSLFPIVPFFFWS